VTTQVDYLEVEDIEVFQALNSPLRMSIIRQVLEPASVKDVAEKLGVPPTRLYYHFNMLEELGVIRVVETRKVGALLQKLYQSVARGFRPSAKLTEGDHSPEELATITTGVVLDPLRLDAEEALKAQFTKVAAGADFESSGHASIGRSLGFFTEERAKAFGEKLSALLSEEFDPEYGEDGVEYGFSYGFFPVAGATQESSR